MQENTAMVPLGYKERKEQKENIKGCNEGKDAKRTAAPGKKGSFFKLSFFALVKFSTKKGVTGRKYSTKQGTLEMVKERGGVECGRLSAQR